MPPRKPTVQNFPPDCCGVCKFSVNPEKGEHYMCFVQPPLHVQAFDEGEEDYWLRASPVDPTDPSCRFFSPRCHA